MKTQEKTKMSSAFLIAEYQALFLFMRKKRQERQFSQAIYVEQKRRTFPREKICGRSFCLDTKAFKDSLTDIIMNLSTWRHFSLCSLLCRLREIDFLSEEEFFVLFAIDGIYHHGLGQLFEQTETRNFFRFPFFEGK